MNWGMLAVKAADDDGGAARNAETDCENDEQYGGGSDGGARQEIEEHVIQAHGEEYGAGEWDGRDY